jgi:DNA recombination protein RmuC
MAAGGTDMELFLGGLLIMAIAATVFFAMRWKGAATELEGRREELQSKTNELNAKAQEIRDLTSVASEHARKVEGLESKLAAEERRSTDFRTERDQYLLETKTINQKLSDLGADYAALSETLKQEKSKATEQENNREQMKLAFKDLADQVMKDHGETFKKQNKDQIDLLLTPLSERINEFKTALHTAHTESNNERVKLGEQLRSLTAASATMTAETANLTRALKGESQTQGAWGQMILESILERSGLRAGEEYSKQEHHAGEDGSRLISDVIVNLPNGQRIVIDSKVSLTAFEAYVNSEGDEERAIHMKAHLASLKTHIRGLSSKAYHVAADSPVDYVIMFVANEGALAAAVRAEPTLSSHAVENNVPIATPTTLMIALRTVRSLWQIERRNRNAEDIAKRAGLLYDKFSGFIGDMQSLGTQLEQAQKKYGLAMEKLSTGRGHIVRQIEQLKEMGAKTTKSLPLSLIGDDESVSDEPLLLQQASSDAAE